MRWRVVKRVPINEVMNRLSTIEKKYGDNLVKLQEDFLKGRLDRERFDDYVEWSGMNHALNAAREGEDFEYYAEEEIEMSIFKINNLTLKKLEICDYIADQHVTSINELAKSLNRNVKNVYNDLKFLESIGFINFVKAGKRNIPELVVQEVTIQLG
jgi:predicted transcriptional regulator